MALHQREHDTGVIVVDWGTTHLRAWLLDGAAKVVDARSAATGMGRLAGDPAAFATAYDALTEGWPTVAGLACGMVGARQGWAEAPYVTVPARLDRLVEHVVHVTSERGRRLSILPGLCQTEPADVMRGEETKLLGLLASAPGTGAKRTALLAGTHAKHVRLAAGTVEGFTSVPTGELFELLSRHSILRLSLEGADGDDPEAFADAVRRGATLGAGGLLAALFELRARALLEGTSPVETLERLSGLLIGAELALLPPGCPVLLVASGELTEPYELAFAALQRPAPTVIDGADLVLRGLTELARELQR